MAAKKGNRNAAKDGESLLVRIRLERPDPLVKEAIQAMSPEDRGKVLDDYVVSQSIVIVADCSRCGEPINATEPMIYWDGVRICESCHMIAMAAKAAKVENA